MDYHEKLIWGQFLAISAGCGYFAVAAVHQGKSGVAAPLFGGLILLIIVQIVYSILVSATSKPEPVDERTRLIGYKSYKVAYLAMMVIFTAWVGFYLMPVPGLRSFAASPLLVVAVWFAVEAIRTGTQLLMHRASVRV